MSRRNKTSFIKFSSRCGGRRAEGDGLYKKSQRESFYVSLFPTILLAKSTCFLHYMKLELKFHVFLEGLG